MSICMFDPGLRDTIAAESVPADVGEQWPDGAWPDTMEPLTDEERAELMEPVEKSPWVYALYAVLVVMACAASVLWPMGFAR